MELAQAEFVVSKGSGASAVQSPAKKEVLIVVQDSVAGERIRKALAEWFEITVVNREQLPRTLASQTFDGFFILDRQHDLPGQIWNILQASSIFDQMHDGIVIVDSGNRIVWANRRMVEWFDRQPMIGHDFFEGLGNPVVQGDSANPLATARRSRSPKTATVKVNKKLNFRITATPLDTDGEDLGHMLVTFTDISNEARYLQKLEAIHNAGAELADLTAEEVVSMSVSDRIELLKANIIHYTQDVLEFDVLEIRLVDRKSNRCESLLSAGIDSEESRHPLFAESTGNGVTGYVCATGQSYLCEDTTQDPLYLRGLIGARSSLTVPLVLHDQVIGSFNVESPEPNAFRPEDTQLLQIFARDIASALNSLELLAAEKTIGAQGIVESIQTSVNLPIDEVLNDTVHLIENQQGHDAATSRRLRRILKNLRVIRDLIQTTRNNMAFGDSVPQCVQGTRRPFLMNRRVLVIDTDSEVRKSAHKLLEPHGCVVETAQEGAEAIMMVRNCEHNANYDAIIADIRLPDFSGYEILMRLKSMFAEPPLILMTGYGYDPGHSIVKARQAGLKAGSVVFKPFKVDQLMETLERTIQPT